MKKHLHLGVAVLCLLMLFLGTASCLFAQPLQPQHSACDDCPKHAPVSHETPVCCSTSQQPSAVTASVEIDRPALISAAFAPYWNAPSASAPLLATRITEPPLSPPRISLRV